jgi:Na+-transporting methylmalonyl-CoA/oxaloacetate decarboxylase gamma subunit
MAEERITETTDAQGNVTGRTIERDTGPAAPVTVNTAPASGGGGMGMIFGILLLLVLAVGGYFLLADSDSEVARDNAVAEAAQDVGDAAEKAGNAVEKAADEIAN